MDRSFASIAAAAALSFAGCASYPAPVQHLADAETATTNAEDYGAARDPQASQQLRIAKDELAQARQEMRSGDNKRASFLLARAQKDAELALALTRAHEAEATAARAQRDLQASMNAPGTPGTETSTTTTTTTTSGVAPAPRPGTILPVKPEHEVKP
jgi:hypothetical protein